MSTFIFNGIKLDRAQFIPVVANGKIVGIAKADSYIGRPPQAISIYGDVYRKKSYNANLRDKYTWITRKPIRKFRTLKWKIK